MVYAIIRTAYDLGIDFFDCSDFYGCGRAEQQLGLALEGIENVVLATKVGILPRLCEGAEDLDRDFSAEHIRRSAETSLRRLRRGTIDLYQLHGPSLGVIEHDETWRALEDLKQSGKIRHIGVSLKSSHMQGASLIRWLTHSMIDSIQLEYSAAHPARVRSMDALKQQKTIIARSILNHGMLLPDSSRTHQRDDHRSRKWDTMKADRVRKFLGNIGQRIPDRNALELLLRLAIDGPGVALALAGATSPAQVQSLVTVANSSPLSVQERTALLDEATVSFAT